MSIRAKLQILGLVTVIGLGLILVVTVFGLNSMRDAEETAHRRESYVSDLIEIKASAMSTILLDPTAQETRDVFAAAEKNVDRHGGTSVQVIRRADVRDELKKILAQWTHYIQQSQALIALSASDATAANAKLLPLYTDEFKPFQAALGTFIEARRQEAAQGVAQAKSVSASTFWEIIALVALVAVVNVSMVFMLSLSLQSSLRGILQQLIPLRQGDLTQRLPATSKDELGEIAAGVNAFIQELQTIVQRTRDRSSQLAKAALQCASASAVMLQSSALQSDATASVAAAVEQFSVSIDQVASNASQAEQKATLSGRLSQSSGVEVSSAVDEIRRIEQVVSAAAGQMQALGQQAKDITTIVNVIKEVADQTNLLALNAAIEAARAGESGRGFAVVADEVRKLAERTSKSAQEITSMVSAIQQSTEAATGVMHEGTVLVVKSVREIEEAGSSMQKIDASSADVVGAVSEISSSLSEQRTASAEIATNVERIAQMTDAGRTTAAEVSSAAQNLERLAEELQAEVAKFRV